MCIRDSDEILMRDADARRERQNLINRFCSFHALQVEIGGLRHLRKPTDEPAIVFLRMRLQEQSHCRRSDRQDDACLLYTSRCV